MKREDTKKGKSSKSRNQPGDLSNLSVEEAQHLIHNLQRDVEKKNKELGNVQVQLEKARNRYSELYDRIPVSYYTFDENGLILEANFVAAEQLSVEKKTLINTQFTEHIAEEDLEIFFSHLRKTYETKARQMCEIKLIRRDGSEFYAELKSRFVQDDEENVTCCRTAISDISEYKRTEDALRRRDGELALLNRVSQAFSSTLELDQILITVLEEVRRLLEVIACSIWLRDPETDELVCKYAIGPSSETVRGWRLAPGQGIAGTVARTGKSLIVPDVWGDKRHFNGVDKQTGQPLRSILSVAMKVKQEIIGVLQVLDTETNRFNSTDQALQELLVAAASFAIENAQLNERLQHETKTKTLLMREVNRRARENLGVVVGLFSSIRRHAGLKKHSLYQEMVTDFLHRVEMLTIVHDLISDFEWNPLPLGELSDRIIHSSLRALSAEKQVLVYGSSSPVLISPKQANSLALVIHELVTNTVRHAILDRDTGHITIHIVYTGDTIQFEFSDDGQGYPDNVLQFEQHNIGIYLIQKIVHRDLHGELTVHNDNGAVTVIRFKTPEESNTK